jgi:hypothetical protein
VSLILSGHDDRVKAAVPLSGTHAWERAIESPQAWQHTLLAQAGLTMSSPGWVALQQALIDPAASAARATAKVLMANGTTDEFFPLTAHFETWDAIPGGDKRTSLAANYDHGCFSLTAIENGQKIADRADLRARGAQRLWFRHWFGTDDDYSYLPRMPTASVAGRAVSALVADVDPGGSRLQVEEVRFWWSGDDAFHFLDQQLDHQGGSTWGKLVPLEVPASSVWFVDVVYRTRSVLSPERFSLSSRPHLPAGHVPRIRSIENCQ